MKLNFRIDGIETKSGRNGKQFKQLKTTTGAVFCFDSELFEDLEKSIGMEIEAEIIEKNNFKNITKIYSKEPINPNEVMHKINAQDNSKHAVMIISYVKDLVVAGKIEMLAFEQTVKDLMKLIKILENSENAKS